ncbi:MAG: hypothetical protein ACOYM3_01655 [Terrimicrobiaceae bacterium]
MNKNALYIFSISKAEIERCDTRRFIALFRPTSPSSLVSLADLFGSVMFTISGYDDSPDELYSIPEVRKYLAKVQAEWPCWLYFSELESQCLQMIALCLLKNIHAKKVSGQPTAMVSFDKSELTRFLFQCMKPLEKLAETAHLPHEVVHQRAENIFRYFSHHFSGE